MKSQKTAKQLNSQPKKRKIPVPKRHHGVRDPLKQAAERLEKIKDKINNPPKEHDVQEVSNRFKRFVELKNNYNDGSFRSKKQNNNQKEAKKLQFGDSYMVQHPKEPETAFLERAERENADRFKEAEFAAKYNVDIERNEKTGAIKLKKKPKNEIDELLKAKEAGKRGLKKKKKLDEKKQEKMKLAEKAKAKVQKKIELKRKEEDILLNEYQFDNVEFGEVVHEPPTLNVKPRKADRLEGAPRPGRKKLLLHSLLGNADSGNEVDDEVRSKKKKKVPDEQKKIDKKGKRKNLPISTRMILEREQQNVVELYRQAKKMKMERNNKNE